jgi:uncharacterized iron-regulated protein
MKISPLKSAKVLSYSCVAEVSKEIVYPIIQVQQEAFMRGIFFCLLAFTFFNNSRALATGHRIVDGAGGMDVPFDELVLDLQGSPIIIISELHDFAAHHEHQFELLSALAAGGRPVHAGFEFFPADQQADVDQWLIGKISEIDFLKKIGWGGTPFEFYRRQALLPATTGGRTLALNAPAWLTKKVAKLGVESLTDTERLSLPNGFALGNSLYLERFRTVMGEHVPVNAIGRYFAAQSIWDDTMAETACQFSNKHPGEPLIIIVGDFHASYGGGLPDRIRARGCSVKVISQVAVETLKDVAHQPDVQPDPLYGPRGDFIWASVRSLATLHAP